MNLPTWLRRHRQTSRRGLTYAALTFLALCAAGCGSWVAGARGAASVLMLVGVIGLAITAVFTLDRRDTRTPDVRRQENRADLRKAIVALPVLFVGIATFAWLHGSGTTDSAPAADHGGSDLAAQTTAFKVAALDAGTTTPSDVDVAAVQAALDDLVGTCAGTEAQNADAAQAAHAILADHGIDESRLSVLLATRRSVPPSARGLLRCDDLMATYVVLRTTPR